MGNQLELDGTVQSGEVLLQRRAGVALGVEKVGHRITGANLSQPECQHGLELLGIAKRTMNVAYDCWLHTISNPSWNNNPPPMKS